MFVDQVEFVMWVRPKSDKAGFRAKMIWGASDIEPRPIHTELSPNFERAARFNRYRTVSVGIRQALSDLIYGEMRILFFDEHSP